MVSIKPYRIPTYRQVASRWSVAILVLSAVAGALYGIENTFGHGENGVIPFALIFPIYLGLPCIGIVCLVLFLHWLGRRL